MTSRCRNITKMNYDTNNEIKKLYLWSYPMDDVFLIATFRNYSQTIAHDTCSRKGTLLYGGFQIMIIYTRIDLARFSI